MPPAGGMSAVSILPGTRRYCFLTIFLTFYSNYFTGLEYG
ncbi:hypothetical protein NEIPOLOT_00427 [Neisseria polysaccharea ATCC 43768]|nr:hypothetical protein NEIPOLOT_00427 [Neisseria polysaccharea ATCC 43768]